MTVDTVDEVGVARERIFLIEGELATQRERLAGFEQTASELEIQLDHLGATKQALINRHARGENVSDDLVETRRNIAAAQSELGDVTETLARIKGIVEETERERRSAMSAEQSARASATGDDARQKMEVAKATATRLVSEIKEAAALFDTTMRLQGGNAVRSDLHLFARDVETWAQLVR
jgi:chromosome segregation ATPase